MAEQSGRAKGWIVRPDRYAKPFFRSARNAWYVQAGGRQVKLHADRDEAFRRYHDSSCSPSGAARIVGSAVARSRNR
jgi:hypothetical protein